MNDELKKLLAEIPLADDENNVLIEGVDGNLYDIDDDGNIIKIDD